ncbi:MAG TPA: SusD/RagB family nutrient-binding outer membrane lipoprotein [Muricauda sp.]|nr:SusD/RagB family nutrient-binding outer membrane lipoprotein [uncultured Allomuricauda sp.]MBC74264.1 SusD/RagB family nutrient-binding outer membrane lipoprotein [Allomuricauda sp.]HBU79888.1 SusD/RagB family nutrient-binding outer membrane lipoprotein [Allomuricauda sp.]|tara:strand:- start:9632 stop:11074 length:1443 start_codon:yes stop_codon:yes gene_type:complete
MKNISLILIFFGLLVVSCTSDFDSINDNPNEPQEVSPEFLLTNVIAAESNEHTYNQGLRLNNYLAQFNADVEFERIDRYELGSNSGHWNLIYSLLADLESMETLPGYNEAYDGVAEILRSYLFSQLTDMWGDVPYSEAIGFADFNFTPIYDTQESIYTDPENGIIARLDAAVAKLQNTTESIRGDIMFGNDLTKWIRFANSLQVRYYLRISKKITDFSDLQQLADEDMLMQSNADNAVVPYLSSAPNQFPLFSASTGIYQGLKMSGTVEQTLKNWDDPRIAVFFNPTQESLLAGTPEFKGMPNGLSTQTISEMGIVLNDVSNMSDRFRAVPDGVDAQLMLYSEVQFALAEAVERGYITGNAQTYYENGIKAHFEYYSTEVPGDYFSRDVIALNGSMDENLEKILTQKWLSLFMVGHEAWFNIRRTGIPALIPGLDNFNDNQYPSRYLYPESEQAANKENYDQAVSRIGGDNINVKSWWEM